LAEVDEADETLSGPATRQILKRELEQYGDQRFKRLAGISVAHIYNLRKSRNYREKRLRYEKARPVPIAIGERRRPDPQGKPGYLRVDTVHQGDLDGVKGVYHINAVDEVTQWQVVGATAQIGEQWLIPVLEAMLGQFPFRILGFHSDNGSEFINHTVARLLNKLLAEQTKSRPRHSNDNGLVESKNAAVIRKHIGYGYITASHPSAMMTFYREHLNPYLNFHRPCGVPEITTDNKGNSGACTGAMPHPGRCCNSCRSGLDISSRALTRRPCNGKAIVSAIPKPPPHAGSQAEAVCWFRTETQRMKAAAEMTPYGRRGKPKPGFPPPPQALEIALRFPHSRSCDGPWKSGKPKTAFPLSHSCAIPWMEFQNKEQGGLKRGAALPTSGSFFD